MPTNCQNRVLAAEIIENLEAALDQFRGVVEGLDLKK
jgi:hypothetical protein